MKDLLRHFDGEAAAAERQTPTADLVTQDTQGIRDLIKVLLEETRNNIDVHEKSCFFYNTIL